MNGQMIGSWRRRSEKHGVIIETSLLIKLNKLQRAALQTAVERYARFIGMPVKF
jgi:hypothetical protein